jgi:hypothetical protein
MRFMAEASSLLHCTQIAFAIRSFSQLPRNGADDSRLDWLIRQQNGGVSACWVDRVVVAFAFAPLGNAAGVPSWNTLRGIKPAALRTRMRGGVVNALDAPSPACLRLERDEPGGEGQLRALTPDP